MAHTLGLTAYRAVARRGEGRIPPLDMPRPDGELLWIHCAEADGYLAVQQNKFAALGLAPWFDAVVFSDALGRQAWKPSTKPFEQVLTCLNVSPAEAVYIGDNPTKDFLGARTLGMHTIWLRHQDGQYSMQEPPTPQHKPDYTLPSLEALAQMINV